MADDSNRIGSSRAGTVGADLLRQLTGTGATGTVSAGSDIVARASGGGASGGALAGPRGNRILPADTPLDQLDRRAARGTYLDILV